MGQDRIATVVLIGLAVCACVAPPSHAKSLDLVSSIGSLRTRRGENHGRQLIPLEGFGANPNAIYRPLGECQGDCDEDNDCKGELVCFQRDPGDPVPGCDGGEEAMSRTDYCIVDTSDRANDYSSGLVYVEQNQPAPSEAERKASPESEEPAPSEAEEKPAPESEEPAPSEAEEEPSPESEEEPSPDSVEEPSPDSNEGSSSRSSSRSSSQESDSSSHYFAPEENDSDVSEVEGYDGYPPENKVPMKMCEGDCDRDSDCEGTLICYQRTAGWPVPGCSGDTEGETDYCVQRTGNSASDFVAINSEPATETSESQLIASDGEPALVGLGSDASEPALVGLGSDASESVVYGSLQECEGDCDKDDDCQGTLVCFQRDAGMEVPGCSGISESNTDFCVLQPPSDRTDNSDYYVFPTGSDSQEATQTTDTAAVQEEEQSAASRRILLPCSLITIALLSSTFH